MKIKTIMVQLKRQLVDKAINLKVLEHVQVKDKSETTWHDEDNDGVYISTKMCLDSRSNMQKHALVMTRIVQNYK